ncbi:MAG: SusD/RagB family nutrient-binding outer membrane lipoprotein [Tannerellaceae bacterium]|nr:SusD/RagB family nutrient-binding outer membrane lipoprotein [Tannerellaceae bacterium]
MKNILKLAAVCAILIITPAACDLTPINVNPNQPSAEVDYNLNDARLASTFRASLPAVEGDDEQRVKSLMVDFYAQMLDGGDFTTRNYLMNEDWNQRMYRRVQNAVASLNIVIRNLGDRSSDFAQAIAVAKIWRAYVESIGIDYFGPIPFAKYSEAEENPPYMSVENAYNEFFKELEEAVALLDKGGIYPIFNDPASDIIYRNDPAKWRKFANSLRLRLALRLSEVKPELCKEQAAKAIASGVMESAADNAYIPPKADGGWGQDYNYTMFQITWGGPLKMTSTMEKLLTGIGGTPWPDGVVNRRSGLSGAAPVAVSSHPETVDPRGPLMFDPAYENGAWRGYPDGMYGALITGDYATGVLWAELGTLIRNGSRYVNRPYDVFLYEEVCFLKAEAAHRGFIAGDAKSEYEKGVRASFATWGVGSKADEYLASTGKNLAGTSAGFDDNQGPGNTPLEKIITQKYLALFPDMSMEAWSDHRRLNLPRFDVPMFRDELLYNNSDRNFLNPSNFIRRVQYPQNEIRINKAEYDKGVGLLGGRDLVNVPIWWDLGKNYCTSEAGGN